MIAFSSEAGAESREEYALKQHIRAFSSEMDTDSREENASDKKVTAWF
jgi:hypothetical protein